MKNFLLADSSELMMVRLISKSWAKKRLIPTYLTSYTSSWWKIFFSPIRANFWLLNSFRPPEPKNVWFLLSGQGVRRVDENFLLADSSELKTVRLISASWGQKRLILTFWTWFTSSWWKIFFSPIRASWWLLDSFRPPEAKKRLIPTFLTWCTSSWWKIFFSPIRASWWLLDSFRPPEPKNVWFLLSGHDVRRVHEKFSSRRFERADGC